MLNYLVENHNYPTLDEMAIHFNVGINAVYGITVQLQKRGYLEEIAQRSSSSKKKFRFVGIQLKQSRIG